MARRRKLNISKRTSNNEGTQSIPTNGDSTSVQGSDGADTGSCPSGVQRSDGVETGSVIHESVESHSIPSDIEAEEEEEVIVEEPKRRRGPTRMLDIWDMEPNEIIIVKLDNYGRPIGEEATTLNRFLGSIVRRAQYAPISYKSWKLMPLKYKEDMLNQIEKRFEFIPPITDATREMLKSNMNEKWRQWKGDLKAVGFDRSKTKEEIVADVDDDRVDEAQYRELVDHWFSDEAQMKKGKGVMPERKDIYIETRTRKDGSIVNEKAAKVIEELKKHSSEAGTSESSQNKQNSMSWKDDIFFKCKELKRRDVCDVWASFLNLKNQRLICLKMRSCVVELRLWRGCWQMS